MTSNMIKVILILIIATISLFVNRSEADKCRIFDLTAYKNKPKDIGMEKIRIWSVNRPMPVNQTGLWVINKEDLPMKTINDIDQNILEYVRVIESFKVKNPQSIIGIYSILPNRQYWIKENWAEINEALKVLSYHVDVIFPSIYTFYPDVGGWVDYAEKNIKQARQYGKPVYVFLWPKYHNSNQYIGGKYIEAGFWNEQLKTSCRFADGIVVWSGEPSDWKDNMPWYKGIVDFGLKH